eukprot:3128074-Heterocapsa_arctica.AAC.1
MRVARRLASRTRWLSGGMPAGSSSERKILALPNRSERLAFVNVLQGGPPCSQRILPKRSFALSERKWSSLTRSKHI